MQRGFMIHGFFRNQKLHNQREALLYSFFKTTILSESQQMFGTCYSVLALPDIVLGDYRISLNCHTTKALTRQEGPNEF